MTVQRVRELLSEFAHTSEPQVIFLTRSTVQEQKIQRVKTLLLGRVKDLENEGFHFNRLKGFLIVNDNDFVSVIDMISIVINSRRPLPQGEVFACFHEWQHEEENHAIIMLKDSAFSGIGDPVPETLAHITHELVHVHDENLKSKLPPNCGRLAVYADQFWSEFIANKTAASMYSPQYKQQQIGAILQMDPIIPHIWLLSPSTTVWQLLEPFGRILGLVPDQDELRCCLIRPLMISNPDIASLVEAIYPVCVNADYLRYRPILEITQALEGWYDDFKRKYQA